MAQNPYAALGVSPSADTDEIKKAYRKIARTAHPDLNPDDPTAEARFKAAAAAYDLLKDPEQRARFDRGEINASGSEQGPRQYYRDSAGGPQDSYSRSGFDTGGFGSGGFGIDPEDIFAAFSRAQQGQGQSGRPFGGFGQNSGPFDMSGRDRRYNLEVPFLDAVRGAKTRISMPDGGDLSVTIPPGTHDGLTLRLRGKGHAGQGIGGHGDAYVTLTVAPHPVFRREGDDIHVTLNISIDEAILGGKISAPTIDGDVRVNVPKGANSGQVLRLRERGVTRRGGGTRGDQLIELQIVMPPKIDDDLRDFMESWRKNHAYNPRGGQK